MQATRPAVTETDNTFRQATVMASQAAPSYPCIIWRLSAARALSDIREENAAHNGNGFWPKGQEMTSPHPWCRRVCLSSWEDSAAFLARLKQWINDSSSQPDLEEWHQTTGHLFFHQPRATFAMPESGSPVPCAGPTSSSRPGESGGMRAAASGAGGSGGGASVPPIVIGEGGSGGGSDSDAHKWLTQLITDLDQTGRLASDDEVSRIRQIVVRAGFYPEANKKALREYAGKSLPRGTVQLGMFLDAAEDHYLRHTEKLRQWPPNASFADYIDSLRAVILNPQGNILLEQAFRAGN